MSKIKEILRSVPGYGWIAGIVYYILQYGMYRLANALSVAFGTIKWAFVPKIAVIDDLIPVVPFLVVFYVFSYVFWICGPIIASVTEKKNFINYLIGLSAAYLIGFMIFLFAPTYMDRASEGIMEIAARPGLFNRLLAIVYSMDGGNLAFNLFPSYHCLISIYCYLGIRKRPEVSKGVRAYSLIMALLICLSTVCTKQHYVIDIFGGLGISIACYAVVQKIDPASRIMQRKKMRKHQ